MIRPVVTSDRGVTVIGGGAVQPAELKSARNIAPVFVAADGGADCAFALGETPDWVIGDLDSISDAARDMIPADRILHIAEQNSTDFDKCLQRISAPFVLAVGFTGLRLDHTLAALTVMANTEACPVILLSSEDVAFLAPPRVTLPLMPGTRVSLYPMGSVEGESRGLAWPIDGIEFAPAGRVGTSNQATGLVTLKIQGKMLIFLPRDNLVSVLTALHLPVS